MKEDKNTRIQEKLIKIKANNLIKDIAEEVKRMQVDLNESIDDFTQKVQDSLKNRNE